jgi:hypothetical protein
MDNKIKTTLVAAAVSSALVGIASSAAFAASHALPTTTALPSYDYNASIARKANKPARAANIQFKNNQQNKSINLSKGLSFPSSADHRNKLLNVNTFSWATSDQKVSPVPFNVLNRKVAVAQASQHFATVQGVSHGVSSQSLAQSEVKYVHDTGRGGLITKYQQKVNGLEVHQRQFNVLLNQKMELVATSGYFSKAKAPLKALGTQFKLSAGEAISKAFVDMSGETLSLSQAGEKGKYQHFKAQSEQYTFSDDPRGKKIYYPGLKQLIPAYYVEIMASKKGSKDLTAYNYVISANTGKVLQRHNMVRSEAFTYKVFADDTAPFLPFDSPMGNELSPHPTGVYDEVITETQVSMNDVTLENSGISTNDPWLPDGATATTGNNVDAYADLYEPDGFTPAGVDNEGNATPGDIRAEITSAGTFDYQYTHGPDDASITNIKSAIVNLFYVINHLHDTYYNHGFNEASGTAQTDNYGRGGIEGDAIHAEAQDHLGLNNATMATPADGTSPRMHMFLWSAGTNSLNVGNLPEVPYFVSTEFGTQSFEVEAEIVRMTDAVGDELDGCETPTNADAIAGNIVIVNRGECSFASKARAAEAAGAIAVLIANNTPDDPDGIQDMAFDDEGDIGIPTAMVSYNSGIAIDEQITAGNTFTTMGVTLEVRDGTVDNPIIEHEWGHYLTHRLTDGGLYANNQGDSMGEGWGDFVALMTMVREEDQSLDNNDHWQGVYNDGGYAVNNGFIQHAYYFGLRRAPYSTNMAINGLTFKHLQDQVDLPDTHPISGGDFVKTGVFNSEIHAAGEIWAMALWESYAALLNRDELDFTQAQSRMMDYMVAGLKITPASPTFTEARDAMLAVAIANDVEDYNVMRAAFTKRGMGPSAVSPLRNDFGWDETVNSAGNAGVVESFEPEATSVQLMLAILDTQYVSLDGAYCDTDNVLDVGETGAFKFVIRNSGTQALSGIKAQVTTRANVTLGNDGMVEFSAVHSWNDAVMGEIPITLNSARTSEEIQLVISFLSDDRDVRVPENIDVSLIVNRDISKDITITIDDFETPAATSADWTQEKIGPADSGEFDGIDDWVIYDVEFETGNVMWGPDGDVQTDLSLMTPMVTVAPEGDFSMDFIHYYEFESSDAESGEYVNWDGGVMEISIDGGDWTDVVEAGGTFLAGYNGTIGVDNPVLSGRDGFVDYLQDLWIVPESISFENGLLNGHNVQFRFRIGTDQSVGAWGWNIDDVSFFNATNAMYSTVLKDSGVCVNRPPAIGTQTQEVTEASGSGTAQSTITLSVNVVDHDDPRQKFMGHYDTYEAFAAAAATNSAKFSYAWAQMTGPSVELDDSHSATPSFTAPVVGEDTAMTFSVEVSDGSATSTATVSVNLINVNSAPVIDNITGPTSVKESQEVTLMASAADPEGDAMTYTWTQTAGSATEFESTTDTLTFNAPLVDADETITFSATAMDAELTSEPTSYSFTVKANTAPTVMTTVSAVTVNEGQSVMLTAVGHDSDEGDHLTYTWKVNGSTASATGSTFDYTAAEVGSTKLVLVTVTASDGLATSEKATINVTVNNKVAGGIGFIGLLLAPFAFIRRRRMK